MSAKGETASASHVYVVQDSKLNLAKATKWGKLIALLPDRQNIVISAQPCLRALRQKLTTFNDNDTILLLGDPIAIGLAIFVAAEVNNGRVRCLKFDRNLNDYFEVSIDLYDRPEKDGDK
jgi:hypothetical protein